MNKIKFIELALSRKDIVILIPEDLLITCLEYIRQGNFKKAQEIINEHGTRMGVIRGIEK